jgi:uncharacterized membrane protein
MAFNETNERKTMTTALFILTFITGFCVGTIFIVLVLLFLTGAFKTEREMERVARRARMISEDPSRH